MLPLSHFRRRGFSTANASAFLLFASLLGALFMITQLFQLGLGYSPLEAGVRILVRNTTPLLVAPIVGALADRFGNRPFMLGGLVFPSVANAVTSSVPLGDAGVAAGVNNALRELGGVFGVAVAAAVFTTYGGYGSPGAFIDGAGAALWVSAGAAGVGVAVAAFAPGRA